MGLVEEKNLGKNKMENMSLLLKVAYQSHLTIIVILALCTVKYKQIIQYAA